MLEALIAEAMRSGWASGTGTMPQVEHEARLLGLTQIPNRRSDTPVTTLRPVKADKARPKSLSAKYGDGDQPLHTDGAHLAKPPDLVLLTSTQTSNTPTRLWKRPLKRLTRLTLVLGPPAYVTHGIFLVNNGRDSFFAAAYTNSVFRYDPGCMEPCDARARQTVAYFEEATESATDHLWDTPNTVLVIDNRKVLHARGSAIDEPHRELLRTSFYTKRSES